MIPYYFDWAATSPMSERSIQAYVETARNYRGNPSALHKDGVAAAKALHAERERTARLLKVSPKEIIYTSGATESNAIILQSLLWRPNPGRVVLSAIEHDSVLQYRRILESHGYEVELVRAPGGYVDPESLAQALNETTQMVCIMLVNNVLGTVQDMSELTRVIRNHEQRYGRRVHVHCDAVQAPGKIPFNLGSLGVDSASFSAHKFQGPKGTGFLYLRSESWEPLSRGGGQERGIRPGTEHLAAIVAMNIALEEALLTEGESLEQGALLRRLFEKSIAEEGSLVKLISPPFTSFHQCTPFIFTCVVPHIPSEVFTRIMYDKGFCISSGSACSNNASKGSNDLLTGAGIASTDAGSAVRISFGADTDEHQIRLLAETMIREARKMSSLMRKR